MDTRRIQQRYMEELEKALLKSLSRAAQRTARMPEFRGLVTAIAGGDIERARELLDALPLDRDVTHTLRRVLAQAAKAGITTARMEIRRGPTIDAEPIIREAEERGANLIVQIRRELREQIRDIIAEGIDYGLPATDIAAEIASPIPLNARQRAAVRRFAERGASAKQIARYMDELRWARALMVARTEVSGAIHRARLDLAKRAERDLMWSTADDELVCPICEPLDRTTASPGEEFAPDITSPPAHPNCRCTTILVEP
jgi:SPP1 gp7 family putative phage head morphogenesis protein